MSSLLPEQLPTNLPFSSNVDAITPPAYMLSLEMFFNYAVILTRSFSLKISERVSL